MEHSVSRGTPVTSSLGKVVGQTVDLTLAASSYLSCSNALRLNLSRRQTHISGAIW